MTDSAKKTLTGIVSKLFATRRPDDAAAPTSSAALTYPQVLDLLVAERKGPAYATDQEQIWAAFELSVGARKMSEQERSDQIHDEALMVAIGRVSHLHTLDFLLPSKESDSISSQALVLTGQAAKALRSVGRQDLAEVVRKCIPASSAPQLDDIGGKIASRRSASPSAPRSIAKAGDIGKL